MPPGGDGCDARHAVFVRIRGGEACGGELLGEGQHFAGVAVIHLEHGGAALGLDAHALEAEVALLAGVVDGLGVVVEHQQGIRSRVDHLGDELEPFGAEVVTFVDEHGFVLPAGNLAARGGVDDGLYLRGVVGVAVFTLDRHVDVVGLELGIAPAVEGAHIDLVCHAARFHPGGEPAGERFVVAEHEDGLGGGAREVLGAVAEDQRLAGAGHAVDDAVAIAEAARELLLLQIHDAHDVRQLHGFSLRLGHALEQPALRGGGDAHFGKELPADAVDLRQAQEAGEADAEHLPQAFLEGFGVDGFGHLVGTDDEVFGDHLAELAVRELLARHVAEHHAIGPGQAQPALLAPAGEDELRVALQHPGNGLRIVPRLLQRIQHVLDAVGGEDGSIGAAQGLQGVGLPVLDLQDQDAAPGVQDDEIGVIVARAAQRHIKPAQVVVFELGFKPLGKTPLAGLHAAGAGAVGGDQRCHAGASPGWVLRREVLLASYCPGILAGSAAVFVGRALRL